jgi:hypothetical protein
MSVILVLAMGCSDTSVGVIKQKPAVSILSPSSGAVYDLAEPFTIEVQASDRETDVADLTIVWTTNGERLEGTEARTETGATLLLPEGLWEGDHTLGVLVVDGDSQEAEDSVAIVVNPAVVMDIDGDGYDDIAYGGDDCDDSDAAVHPGADEHCDDTDEDCDGEVDEDAVDGLPFHADLDGDTFGDPAIVYACEQASGLVTDDTDCDDAASGIYPGATEHCDGWDEDCDSVVDNDAVDMADWYPDTDGDAFGDPAAVYACEGPAGHVADNTDCDDAVASTYPGATEVCDGVDQDCDGIADDNAIDADTWYADSDGDSYGDGGVALASCSAPAGYVSNTTDCDDGTSTVHPGAAEVCDSVDQDCDGLIDEGVTITYYRDADTDGYGLSTSTSTACSAPAGYVSNSTDCDDADSAENPAADEVCDGDDDDCDGTTDESDAIDATTWHRDADSDGYGGTTTRVACTQPSGYITDATDCDDTDATIAPDQVEVCDDNVDQDCDGDDLACPIEGTVDLGDAEATIYGASASMQLGQGVGMCGDLDDDGLDDACAMGDDSTDAGDLWVFFGEFSGDYLSSAADAHIEGVDASDDLGRKYGNAAGGRDIDGDGTDDLVVGASGDDLYASGSGTAYVFYGPISGTMNPQSSADYLHVGSTANDAAGHAVTLLDDVNGDRYGEVVIAAWGQDTGGNVAGAVYVEFGPLSGYRSGGTPLSGADLTLIGEASADYFGWSLGELDWDGDGLSDLLVGAYGEDAGGASAGAVYVFTGLSAGTVDASAADYKLRGEAAGDTLGWDLSTAGDMNGDGYDDLAAGAYHNDDGGSDAGAVYVVTGNRTGSASIGSFYQLVGDNVGDYAGYSVSGGGDIDADGNPDLLVGAWKNDDGASDAGAAYVVYGPVSSSFDLTGADATLTGVANYDYAGTSVSFLGDTDGDGYDDFIIGAYGSNEQATSAGLAAIFLGAGR